MSIRGRISIATLACALVSVAGCFGTSDDKSDVSPLSANPEGTGRKNAEDVTETGGLGGTARPPAPARPRRDRPGCPPGRAEMRPGLARMALIPRSLLVGEGRGEGAGALDDGQGSGIRRHSPAPPAWPPDACKAGGDR